jgi:hypothetical protein
VRNRAVFRFTAFSKERECEEKLGSMKNGYVSHFPLFNASNAKKSPYFYQHKKDFIIKVFCRNWAVRNPTGTRLVSLNC